MTTISFRQLNLEYETAELLVLVRDLHFDVELASRIPLLDVKVPVYRRHNNTENTELSGGSSVKRNSYIIESIHMLDYEYIPVECTRRILGNGTLDIVAAIIVDADQGQIHLAVRPVHAAVQRLYRIVALHVKVDADGAALLHAARKPVHRLGTRCDADICDGALALGCKRKDGRGIYIVFLIRSVGGTRGAI